MEGVLDEDCCTAGGPYDPERTIEELYREHELLLNEIALRDSLLEVLAFEREDSSAGRAYMALQSIYKGEVPHPAHLNSLQVRRAEAEKAGVNRKGLQRALYHGVHGAVRREK